jgi:hypothetical protein
MSTALTVTVIRVSTDQRLGRRHDRASSNTTGKPRLPKFGGEAEHQDVAQHPAHVLQPHRLRLGLSEQARPQPQPARQQKGERGGQRHDAEPADLDQQEDDHLAERRPVGTGVDGQQTGQAYGRGGGEEGVDRVRALLHGGYRQGQQSRSDEHGDAEAGHQHPGRMQQRPGRHRPQTQPAELSHPAFDRHPSDLPQAANNHNQEEQRPGS